jgi:hypothetical protein
MLHRHQSQAGSGLSPLGSRYSSSPFSSAFCSCMFRLLSQVPPTCSQKISWQFVIRRRGHAATVHNDPESPTRGFRNHPPALKQTVELVELGQTYKELRTNTEAEIPPDQSGSSVEWQVLAQLIFLLIANYYD